MGPKKGLSAFIKSQKTTKDKKTEESSDPTTQDQIKSADAGIQQTQKQNAKNTPGNKKAESSDEEEDELELANKQMSYDNIKEHRDIANLNKGKDQGWDMAQLDEERAEEHKITSSKTQSAGEKKAFGDNTSFSRPTFGRKPPVGGTKFGKDDFAALDDLDNEDSGKKTVAKETKPSGPPSFSNSGASRAQREPREDREERKPAAVKPTFRGRMNLTKTGAAGDEAKADEQPSVGKAYDFGVVYKTDVPEGERREYGEKREYGGDQKRKPQKDRGVELNTKPTKEEDDDEFTLVRNKDNKKKFNKAQNDDSSSDEEQKRGAFRTRGERGAFRGGERGARGERGGYRGDRGGDRSERGGRGGGFFKSSNVAKTE